MSRQLSPKEQVFLFRSLSTFMQSGIPLLRSLECLAEQGESAPVREASRGLARELLTGRSLSTALSRLDVCQDFAVQLLRCAESSGQLAAVLERLAQHYVDEYSRRARLRAALTYPLIMLLASLAMAVLVPTALLKDLLHSFASEGNLPWPTRVLVFTGELASSPWFWLMLIAATGLLSRSQSLWERWKLPLHTLMAHLPGVSPFYRGQLQIQFVSCLALQLRAGLPLLSSLKQAIESSGSPLLESSGARIVTAVMDGTPLSRALLEEPLLSENLSPLLEAGEEIGRLDAVLEWTASLTRSRLETLQDQLLTLLEPLVLLVMGIVVGVVTTGTLLPTFKVLDQL